MPAKLIRIGTRNSPLALWQAHRVKNLMRKHANIESEIISVSSEGDRNLHDPIYKMGITGVFTKTLDQALLEKKVDIAVHSLKDIPTQTAKGIQISAVLERESPFDVLIHKEANPNLENISVIGTGSLRRKSFWLHRYPHHSVDNLRGNIQSRLQKLMNNERWGGAVFAHAAIQRMNIQAHYSVLNWMTPAPGQGAIAVCSTVNNNLTEKVLSQINHEVSYFCTKIERDFLSVLEGGCSQPIGAFARITENNQLSFRWSVLSKDGKNHVSHNLELPTHDAKNIGSKEAKRVLKKHPNIIQPHLWGSSS